jgi:hypothetical protein
VWPRGEDHAQRIAEATRAPIDWDLFVRVVRRHRIDGLAYDSLSAAAVTMPDATRSALKAAAERQAKKSLRYAAETMRVSRILREAGIPAACLKGAPLSILAFGELGLRHCRDIDLLVCSDDALAADDVLNSAGYKLEMPIGPHSPRQKKRWISHRKHFEYVSGNGIPLELHWRLFDNDRLLDMEISPASWTEVPVMGSSSLLGLAPRNLLLYLCVHGANHMWFRLKWLADVQALLQAGPKAVEQLQVDAVKHSCERAVAQTLALTRLLFEVPAAELIAPADAPISALVESALAAMTSGSAAAELEAVPFGTSRVAAARYRLKPNWRFWLRETAAVLVDERDRESVRLPHAARFLLPLLRFPLWAGRRISGRGLSNR